MTESSAYRLRFKTYASIAIGLTSFFVAACSSNNAIIPGGNVGHNQAVYHQTAPTPTPYQFQYATVNDEGGSTTFNRVLGMNDLGQVVGYYSSASVTRGFTSTKPYSKFSVIDYPYSLSTVATSITDNRLIAGYFVDDNKSNNTWGFIRNKGIWGSYKDYKTPPGPNSVNQLWGLNDNNIAVGFYVDSNAHDMPYVLAVRKYHALTPPNAVSARATGINFHGDIVGSEVLANGTTVGWIYRSGVYKQFSFPYSNDTEPEDVNAMDQVVGSYVDSSGATHGFVVTKVIGANPTWQSIDEPNAVGTTVVSGINMHHQISGWFIDSAGNNNGFVGTL